MIIIIIIILIIITIGAYVGVALRGGIKANFAQNSKKMSKFVLIVADKANFE